ncbi:enoyl-CoA delta isomerase 1, mitochondrial-like [Clavelina lepadiformis]|uniref:enoyl-CoA delta isomerase 1, mitochondrial-like n=1 Tax=Clavelina lepadiformis TaxID=159417 RepID=UPI0040420E84
MSLTRSLFFPVRRLLQQQSLNECCRRHSSNQNLLLEQDANTGLATVTLAKAPVNSLDGEFLTSISDTLKKLDADSAVKGILIASKFHGGVYSAGLNILDMFNKSDAHLSEFWRCVQDWYLDLFGCSKPVVAAINGHAPAGGCAMALMCDYRVMQEGKTIGLNETQLGIAAPFFFVDLMTSVIGTRKATLALQLGSMFSSNEALKAGLVDEVVDLNSVIPRAREQLLMMSKVPQPAFHITKQLLRGETMKVLKATREQDIANFRSLIQMPFVQAVIGKYLESLKQKKK